MFRVETTAALFFREQFRLPEKREIMAQNSDYISVRISSQVDSAELPERLLKVLAGIVKRSPDQVRSALDSGSIKLNRVVVNPAFLKLLGSLTSNGFRVERIRDKKPLPAEPNRNVSDEPADDRTMSLPTIDVRETDWKTGEVIEGLYEVHGSAAGGMGKVYFVFHSAWKMMLAIKTPQAQAVKSEASLSRFLREAELWVDLGLHPNIATCYYARVINGLPRLFIEYVDGGSLEDWLEDKGSRELSTVVDLMLQFCYGMIHAEERGMIHRDIKPANCLLSRQGELKITDFGLVKRLESQSDADNGNETTTSNLQRYTRSDLITEESDVLGSPWYMAPERFRAHTREDIRSDVYSFGVMLYRTLVQQMPFRISDAFTLVDLARCHVKAPPVDPLSIRPDLPPGLVEIVMTCLQKKPGNRYPSFVDVCQALERVARHLSPKREPRPRPNLVALKADSLNNQAVSLLDLGREGEARKLLDDAHSANTDHLEAVYNLHCLRWAKGETSDQEVITRMESLRIEVRETPTYKHLMGLISLQRGNAAQGIDLLRKACENVSSYQDRWKDYGGDPEVFVKSLNLTPIQEVRSFAGHVKSIRALRFTPDGDRAFSVGEDRTVRIWDLNSGRCLKTFRTFAFVPVTGTFSPDGRLAVTGYGEAFKTLDLWHMETGKLFRKFSEATAYTARFSPDSRVLAIVGDQDLIRVVDIAAGRVAWEARLAVGRITSLEFLSDNESVVVGADDGSLSVWRPGNLYPVFRHAAHEGPVSCIGVSSGGELIASGGGDGSVRLWSSSGVEIKRLIGHRARVVSAAFLPDDSYVVSGAADGAIKIWDRHAGKCCRTIEFAGEELAGCAVSADGRKLVSGGAKGSVRLWSIEPGWFSRNFLEPALCRPKTFKEVAELHAAFGDAVQRFRQAWKLGRTDEILENFEHVRGVPGFSWSRDAILIRNLLQQVSQRLTLRSSAFIRAFHGHDHSVTCLAPSSHCLTLLTGSLDGTAAIWDVVDGRRLKRIDLGSAAVAVCFLQGLTGFLTLAADGTLRKWDIQGNELGCVEGVAPPVALSLDATTLMALSPDGMPLRIDVTTLGLKEKGSSRCLGDSLCFAQDGKHFYSLRDGTRIQRWSTATGRGEGGFRDLGIKVSSFMPASAEDKIIAGMETGEVVVYLAGSGFNVATLRGHTAAVRAVSGGPDENVWVTGSDDCSLKVWDIAGQRCLATLEGHAAPIRAVRIFANGSMAASGSSDGSVRLWGLEWEVSGLQR